MLRYCLKCRKNVESKNQNVTRTKKEEWEKEKWDSKKSKFMKQQEASGLLSSLGVKTPLSKIPLVGSLF